MIFKSSIAETKIDLNYGTEVPNKVYPATAYPKIIYKEFYYTTQRYMKTYQGEHYHEEKDVILSWG